ncbi:response regulator [Marinoscillum sp.]|uniref:response regulator n=1 Tax=Marinoscillum sp. TaxID=2024838 RepID=UPI003BAC90AD
MRKPVHILLVEDNEGDILLTTEALEESNITHQLSVVRNGKEALDWVFNQQSGEPDLILLDVNLPLKSGHEVLQAIKSDDTVKHIPVIMLTTSSSEKDVNLSYQYAANCYITKPVEVNDFLDAISTLCHFWVEVVTLPKNKA